MQLLDLFKKLSLHPKNVVELKETVLKLALKGLLTNQNYKDNKTAKKDLVEGYYELPKNWHWDKFDNICSFNMGKTPPSKDMEYWDGHYPWVSIADMDTYATIYKTKKTLSEKGLTECFKNGLVKKGTLLMSFKLTIGKTSILGVDACHNEAIISIYPNEKVLQEYLFLFMPIISNWGTQVSALMGNTLNKGKIQDLMVPIPPLQEQAAIVQTVNQLFAEIEQLEELTKTRIKLKEDYVASSLQMLANEDNTSEQWSLLSPNFKTFFTEKSSIKKLRESILQLAVQGKLTAKWRAANPNTEPASELLKRIKAEKEKLIAEKKIKKEKPLPPIEDKEKPFELPDGWEWCRLGDIIVFLNGYAFNSSDYVPSSKFQVIRLGNVKNDSFLVHAKQVFVPEKIGKEAIDYQLRSDDILTTLTGTRGKKDYCFTCIVKDEHLSETTLLLNQRVGCIRAIDQKLSNLLNIFLKSNALLEQLFRTETGTVNQGNIGSTAYKNVVFPLPPKNEESFIVEKVNTLMSLCDQLEEQIETGQTQIEMLMESCLREVFE